MHAKMQNMPASKCQGGFLFGAITLASCSSLLLWRIILRFDCSSLDKGKREAEKIVSVSWVLKQSYTGVCEHLPEAVEVVGTGKS